MSRLDRLDPGPGQYVPAAPWCTKNEAYAATVLEAFRTGASRADFPAMDYEEHWPKRFAESDLNDIGRRELGRGQ